MAPKTRAWMLEATLPQTRGRKRNSSWISTDDSDIKSEFSTAYDLDCEQFGSPDDKTDTPHKEKPSILGTDGPFKQWLMARYDWSQYGSDEARMIEERAQHLIQKFGKRIIRAEALHQAFGETVLEILGPDGKNFDKACAMLGDPTGRRYCREIARRSITPYKSPGCWLCGKDGPCIDNTCYHHDKLKAVRNKNPSDVVQCAHGHLTGTTISLDCESSMNNSIESQERSEIERLHRRVNLLETQLNTAEADLARSRERCETIEDRLATNDAQLERRLVAAKGKSDAALLELTKERDQLYRECTELIDKQDKIRRADSEKAKLLDTLKAQVTQLLDILTHNYQSLKGTKSRSDVEVIETNSRVSLGPQVIN